MIKNLTIENPIKVSSYVGWLRSLYASNKKRRKFWEVFDCGRWKILDRCVWTLCREWDKFNEKYRAEKQETTHLLHQIAWQIERILGDWNELIADQLISALSKFWVNVSNNPKNWQVCEPEVRFMNIDIEEILEIQEWLNFEERYRWIIHDVGIDKFDPDTWLWLLEESGGSIRIRFIIWEDWINEMFITFKKKIGNEEKVFSIKMKVFLEAELDIMTNYLAITSILDELWFTVVEEKIKYRVATMKSWLKTDFDRHIWWKIPESCEVEFDKPGSKGAGEELADLDIIYPNLKAMGFINLPEEQRITKWSHSLFHMYWEPYRIIQSRNNKKNQPEYYLKKTA